MKAVLGIVQDCFKSFVFPNVGLYVPYMFKHVRVAPGLFVVKARANRSRRITIMAEWLNVVRCMPIVSFFSGGGHTLCCEHVPKHTKPEGQSHMRLKQWRTSNSNHQLGLQGSLIFAAPLLHKYRESARHAMA